MIENFILRIHIMKRSIQFLLILLTVLVFTLPLSAEFIFLKNGSIIECKIVRETYDATVIKKNDGKQEYIKRSDIMRILFSKIYMGKLYVHRTDGEIIEAFMVDEDQESYTFRMDITSPNEFKLNRDQVLYMARKNPNNLSGRGGLDNIEIIWNQPVSSVKYYNVYIRTDGKDYFKIDRTSRTWYMISGLKNKTPYFIKVTAVDNDNYESLPSNEIRVWTRNPELLPPDNITGESSVSSDGKSIKAKISWESPQKVGESVAGYRIYTLAKDGYIFYRDTASQEYVIEQLNSELRHFFIIRSFDANNCESDDSDEIEIRQNRIVTGTGLSDRYMESLNSQKKLILTVSARGCMIMPMHDLAGMFESGLGVILNVSVNNFLFYRLDAGIESGYFALNGKDENVKDSYLITEMLSFSYRFNSAGFTFSPRIAGGISYNNVYYYNNDIAIKNNEVSKNVGLEPVVMPGISMSYLFFNMVKFEIGADYGMLFETDGLMDFYSLNAGIGVRF